MPLIKILNTQSLSLKLNYGTGIQLESPILLKSKINFTKVSARKKIHIRKEIMKENSKHIVIFYLHYLGRQENLLQTIL